jgi:signal transduction histidine kinase
MRARILSVGSDPHELDVITRALAPHGYAVVAAPSGGAAFEVLDRQEIDLVLLDAMLPDIDAAEVIREMRRFRGTTWTPLVLVAERWQVRERAQGVEFGADELLDKPIDAASLVLRVQTLLRLKRAQDEAGRREADLARTLREHRGIVESLGHDLRNPLAIVHANLGWVAEHLGPRDAELADALEDAGEALRRLQAMIEDMLLAVRLSRPDQLLKRESIRLGDLLDGMAERHEEAARARNVSLNIAVEERQLEVRGDPTILRRVFDSMIESSLKHTPSSGRVELSARSRTLSPSPSDVEIAVKNSGAPLPPEERDQIIEAIDHGAPLRPSGMGLRLYFCRRAVEAHDGALEVVETADWPTSLVVRLPKAG